MMKIIQKKVKLGEIVKGFNKAQFTATKNDVFCYSGRLNCRPAYQRNYVYDDEKKAAVIKTVMKGYESNSQFPLSIMYWAEKSGNEYELLDGQQRLLSICLFRWGDAVKIDNKEIQWGGLEQAEKDWFNEYELDVYVCVDDKNNLPRFEKELKDWFQVINTNGLTLTEQEKRNAVYYGEWLTDAKKYFSNNKSILFKEGQITELYLLRPSDEKILRQELLEKVLNWRAQNLNKDIDGYMSAERSKNDANDLINYYNAVMKWVEEMFPEYDIALKRSDWGTLYNKYNGKVALNLDERKVMLRRLLDDPEVLSKKLIVEYILSNEKTKLETRQFDDSTKERVWRLQNGKCPLCINEQNLHPEKQIKVMHNLKDMQGDHLVPWSKGGKTVEENCCMLCDKHNRHKSADEISWLIDYMTDLRNQKL